MVPVDDDCASPYERRHTSRWVRNQHNGNDFSSCQRIEKLYPLERRRRCGVSKWCSEAEIGDDHHGRPWRRRAVGAPGPYGTPAGARRPRGDLPELLDVDRLAPNQAFRAAHHVRLVGCEKL